MRRLFMRALEAVIGSRKEQEMVFYGRIVNFDDLKKAGGMERQEQYEIKVDKTEQNSSAGRVRVRMTTKKDADPEYVLTIKTPVDGGGDTELDLEANELAFTQFRAMAPRGMLKDRYFFKFDDNHNWEVDVFPTSNGAYQAWCKIDLEMAGFIGNTPEFPIQLEDVIIAQDGHRTPEEEEKIKVLYDTVFTVPNPSA